MVRAKLAAYVTGFGLLVAALGAMAAQKAVTDRSLSPSMTTATGPIACSNTPFGNAVPVYHDYEDMLLVSGTSRKSIDEYGIAKRLTSAAPPKTGALIQENPSHTALATNRSLRRAVNVDLNGDGRDEVVEVLADGTDVNLTVYDRIDGPPVSAFPASTWTYTEPVLPDTITIVAGDFDGSKTRKREVAVSWVIASGDDAGKVRVVVLQGNGIAHWVQANNNTAGVFLTTNTGLQFPRLVAGDFLAQGRDQIVLAAYDPSIGKVSLDLLEFDNGTHASSVTTALPTLGFSMRGENFSAVLGGSGMSASWFIIDQDNGLVLTEGVNYYAMQASGSLPVIEGFEVNGGDVADTAAAELVYYVMFVDPVESKHVLGQRLLHFYTTRNASNTITGIGLAPGVATGINADSSIVLGTYPDPPPKFAATIADVDVIAKKEIVTAIVGHDGLHGATNGPMTWAARKAYVRNAADFTWSNLEKNDSLYPVVAFTDTSHGEIVSWAWDFGDSSGTGTDKNPRHAYTAGNGLYLVYLTTTDTRGKQNTTAEYITVTGAFDATPQYTGAYPGWNYRIDATPFFSGDSTTGPAPSYLYATPAGNTTIVRVAAGDMDEDGLPEVVVAVNNNGLGVDSHVFWRQAGGSFGRTTLSDATATGIFTMDMVLSDFDGDSLSAVISNVAGDCANVQDTNIFALAWMPPYFIGPQGSAGRAANYGQSSSTSFSVENHSESYFSNSITLSVGVEADVSIPLIAVKVEEIDAKVTVGGEYQYSNGETHGVENSYAVDNGWTVGNDNLGTDEEALVVVQTANSNCYTYIMQTADKGTMAKSKMRACNPTSGPANKTSVGAKYWNESGTVQEPYHWVPVQHDWASIALWHTVKGGSDPATPIAFVAGHGPDKAVDGRFAPLIGDALPADVESTSTVNQPYLEIDLGFVREIHAVRVFPSADGQPSKITPLDFGLAVPDLQGFRLYASATPFAGAAPPTADDFTNVVLDGVSTFVQDADPEAVYRTWSIWTFDDLGTPVQARYLRLQKPTTGDIRIGEIQVFGDTHTEPQFYPEGVCDETVGDGVFKAYVYDYVDRQYKTVQVRGDMVWNGGVDAAAAVPTGVPGCANDASVSQGPIWDTFFVSTGATAQEWNLSSDTTQSDSKTHSEEWSGRVGAEFEAKTGGDILAVVGAAYEATAGITKDNQAGRSVGTGFQIGGGVGGFPNVAPYAYPCNYFPRPYNFTVKEFSDTGYQHNYNVTDYVVRQISHSDQVNVWQRESILALCTDYAGDEAIFHDHFGSNDANIYGF